MQDPREFLARINAAGVTAFAGVPCSILNPLSSQMSPDNGFDYLAASVEGEAVAYAAGTWLGGGLGAVLMQNSGLGNTVNPLMSLAIPYRIPMLLVVSWRGEPGRADEHHHMPMGAITPDLLALMGIPSFVVHADSDADALIQSAVQAMNESRRPAALIIPRGIFAQDPNPGHLDPPKNPRAERITSFDSEANGDGDRGDALSRLEVVQALHARVPGALAIGTTGYMSRTLYGYQAVPNHFYMQGSMGFALGIGLGLAECRPEQRVFVLDGDGALLMRLGSLATVGWRSPANLVHLVFDNASYRSTGGQPSVAPGVDFPAAAIACGYARVATISDRRNLDDALAWLQDGHGPTLLHLRISSEEASSLPRPDMAPDVIATDFRQHIVTT